MNWAEVRGLLLLHGDCRGQKRSDWGGPYELPNELGVFYEEVGPLNIEVHTEGNSILVPSLGSLWDLQRGYAIGLDGEALAGWDSDWLVVASEGGDPYIYSRRSGAILHDYHGQGAWEPAEAFPDLWTALVVIGTIGEAVREQERISPDYPYDGGLLRRWAASHLSSLLEDPSEAESYVEGRLLY